MDELSPSLRSLSQSLNSSLSYLTPEIRVQVKEIRQTIRLVLRHAYLFSIHTSGDLQFPIRPALLDELILKLAS